MSTAGNHQPSNSRSSGPDTAELYKTALGRLNLQDDYLLKFNTLFLTVNGAITTLAGLAYFQKPQSEFGALFLLALVGLVCACSWLLWTDHNHYWHSVWIGILRNIEEQHLSTTARVFAVDHAPFAKNDIRKPLLRGHSIAKLIPATFLFGWAVVLALCLFMYPVQPNPSIERTSPGNPGAASHVKR